jgi:hypothetical protein
VREAPDPDLAFNSRIGRGGKSNPADTWNLENPAGELKSCKCNLPECGRGIAYGCECCGRIQKFGSEFFFQAGSYLEFVYFKKFQVFDFLKSLALAKSCHKMRSGGKIFLKSAVPARKF